MNKINFQLAAKWFVRDSQRISWIILAIGIFAAVMLYSYGSSIPSESRIRGDASAYMTIANGFSSFSDAFTYIGDRTYGYPLFLYIIKLAASPATGEEWLFAIAPCQFVLHILACIFFYSAFLNGAFKKAGLPPAAAAAIAAVLIAYPALVMYTTVPLTDTFCTDLLMLAVAASAASQRATRPLVIFGLLFCSGLVLGYSVLVRPSFGFPLIAFYAAAFCGLFAAPEKRAHLSRMAVMLAASLVLILPALWHIWEDQHTLGLQNKVLVEKYLPQSLQSGLSSVRVYWSGKYVPQDTFAPGVKDPYLEKTYSKTCKVDTAITLAECLLSHPQAIPFYFGKKAIALFDEPHLQPYAVDITPGWFAPLERIFETAAFCGFIAMLILAGAYLFSGLLSGASPVWIGLPWTVFVLTLMSLHSLLHIEGRYGFPFIPFSLASLPLGFAAARQVGRTALLIWIFVILACGACFIYQLCSWDFVTPT